MLSSIVLRKRRQRISRAKKQTTATTRRRANALRHGEHHRVRHSNSAPRASTTPHKQRSVTHITSRLRTRAYALSPIAVRHHLPLPLRYRRITRKRKLQAYQA